MIKNLFAALSISLLLLIQPIVGEQPNTEDLRFDICGVKDQISTIEKQQLTLSNKVDALALAQTQLLSVLYSFTQVPIQIDAITQQQQSIISNQQESNDVLLNLNTNVTVIEALISELSDQITDEECVLTITTIGTLYSPTLGILYPVTKKQVEDLKFQLLTGQEVKMEMEDALPGIMAIISN